jgi:hypothetical protein
VSEDLSDDVGNAPPGDPRQVTPAHDPTQVTIRVHDHDVTGPPAPLQDAQRAEAEARRSAHPVGKHIASCPVRLRGVDANAIAGRVRHDLMAGQAQEATQWLARPLASARTVRLQWEDGKCR